MADSDVRLPWVPEDDYDADSKVIRFLGMKKSLLTETNRPLAFIFHFIAALCFASLLTLDFYVSIPSKPGVWFLKLSTWACITGFPYFIFATFHTVPSASMQKPSRGYVARLIFTEKTQILLFSLVWAFSVMSTILYFSTEFQHDLRVYLRGSNAVALACLLNTLPTLLFCVELFVSKVVVQQSQLVVLVPVVVLYIALKALYLCIVPDPITRLTSPPTLSTYLQFLAILLGSIGLFYIAYGITYGRYKWRVLEIRQQRANSAFAASKGQDDDDDDDEEEAEAEFLRRAAEQPDNPLGEEEEDEDYYYPESNQTAGNIETPPDDETLAGEAGGAYVSRFASTPAAPQNARGSRGGQHQGGGGGGGMAGAYSSTNTPSPHQHDLHPQNQHQKYHQQHPQPQPQPHQQPQQPPQQFHQAGERVDSSSSNSSTSDHASASGRVMSNSSRYKLKLPPSVSGYSGRSSGGGISGGTRVNSNTIRY